MKCNADPWGMKHGGEEAYWCEYARKAVKQPPATERTVTECGIDSERIELRMLNYRSTLPYNDVIEHIIETVDVQGIIKRLGCGRTTVYRALRSIRGLKKGGE